MRDSRPREPCGYRSRLVAGARTLTKQTSADSFVPDMCKTCLLQYLRLTYRCAPEESIGARCSLVRGSRSSCAAGEEDAAAELGRQFEPAIRRAIKIHLRDPRLRRVPASLGQDLPSLAPFWPWHIALTAGISSVAPATPFLEKAMPSYGMRQRVHPSVNPCAMRKP